jgi:hypothetical protein
MWRMNWRSFYMLIMWVQHQITKVSWLAPLAWRLAVLKFLYTDMWVKLWGLYMHIVLVQHKIIEGSWLALLEWRLVVLIFLHTDMWVKHEITKLLWS